MKIYLLGISLFLTSLATPFLAEEFNNDGWTILEESSEEDYDDGWTILEESSTLETPPLAEDSKPLVTPSLVEKSNNFYMSIGGGKAFPSNYAGDTLLLGSRIDFEYHTDDPFFFSIGFGKKFNDYRVEFNYLSGKVNADRISAETGGVGLTAPIDPAVTDNVKSFMIYGYKDFPNESKFTPYLGLGVGIGKFDADDQIVSIGGLQFIETTPETNVFSYALKGGIDYALNDKSALYSEATYQNFGSYEISEPGFETVNYDSTNFFGVSAGIRFFF